MPRVGIVTGSLPPKTDAIGEYAAALARSITSWSEVTLHTQRGYSPDAVADIPIHQSFGTTPRKAVLDLEAAIDQQTPNHLLLQYNPFHFDSKGFNPYLAGVLRRLKLRHEKMQLVVMMHEPVGGASRNFILRAVQNRQFESIASIADLTLFSTGPWFEAYRDRHRKRRCGHLPTGSNLPQPANLPLLPANRLAVRADLGIPPDAIVLGVYGPDHPSRQWSYLAAAARKLNSDGRDVRVLCIGAVGSRVRIALQGMGMIDLGDLPPERASARLPAIDIYCSPESAGVSTGQSWFFAGLQHGLATVTTRGVNTDGALLTQSLSAFIAADAASEAEFVTAVMHLANDLQAREKIAAAARACFDASYSQAVLSERLRQMLIIANESDSR
jgi:glycosyltransferase involved in cell wall biosynthesis